MRAPLVLQHPLCDLLRVDLPIADGCLEIVDLIVAEELGHGVEALGDGEALHLLFQQLPAALDVVFPVLLAQPAANLAARPLGGHILQVRVEPVTAGAATLGRNDTHLVAGLQLVVQRDQLAVDIGAATAMAQLGVDGVGEVDGRRAGGQVHNVATRGEDVDAVVEHVALHAVDEFVRVGDVLPPLHDLAEPADLLLVALFVLALLFVLPVCRDAQFGDLVHLLRADLHLHGPPVSTHHRGVQAAVHVVLGIGDVVVKLAGDGTPQAVHHAQRRVTLGFALDDDAEAVDVVDLLEVHILALHLLPDAEDVFRPPAHLGLDARLG